MPLKLTGFFKENTEHNEASPKIEVTDEGIFTTREYWLQNWSELKSAIQQIKGYPEYSAGLGTAKIIRHLPLRDPDFDTLTAQHVSVSGRGRVITPVGNPGSGPGSGDDGKFDGGVMTERANAYDSGALVTVTFARRPYRILDDATIHNDEDNNFGREFKRYVEIVSTMENVYAAVSSTQNLLKFTGQTNGETASGLYGGKLHNQYGVTLKEPPPRPFGEANVVIKWHEVPYEAFPWVNIRQGVGHINDCNFGNPNDNSKYWRARRLLFTGAAWELKQMADERMGWLITYFFKYHEIPWTHYFNPYANADLDFYPVTIGTRFDNNYPLSTVTRDPETTSPGGIPFAGYIAPDPNDFSYNPYDFRLLFDPRQTTILNPGG